MSDFQPLARRLGDTALRQPGATAVVHGDQRVAYDRLWSAVGAIAGFLTDRGVKRGDRVAIVCENSPEYVEAYYAAFAAGAVAVGLNASARARELGSWISHCGATALFIEGNHPDIEQLHQLPSLIVTIAVGPEAPGTTSWAEALCGSQADPLDVSETDPAAILYTSGTTGRPKGVVLSHGNFIANATGIVEYLELTATDRVMNVLPFFYSYGSSVLHTHLLVGGTIVLENSFTFVGRVLQRMASEAVTGFPGVPSTFALLLQADLRAADLSSLRYMTQAGGPMSSAQITRVRSQLPQVRFFVMYGQTEATARLTYLPPERLNDKLGSVGVPLSGVSLEIRGDDGCTVLPASERGEVWARGRNVMMGYYADEAATASTLHDGWLKTGDLGYLDPDGYLFLEGRRNDIIKCGAHRISPQDIEEVIAALPEVAEVAVLGVPDAILGEAIKAVLVLRSDAVIDAMRVRQHCSTQLPRYKVPKFVEFATRLPRTSSGKIQRYQLRDAS